MHIWLRVHGLALPTSRVRHRQRRPDSQLRSYACAACAACATCAACAACAACTACTRIALLDRSVAAHGLTPGLKLPAPAAPLRFCGHGRAREACSGRDLPLPLHRLHLAYQLCSCMRSMHRPHWACRLCLCRRGTYRPRPASQLARVCDVHTGYTLTISCVRAYGACRSCRAYTGHALPVSSARACGVYTCPDLHAGLRAVHQQEALLGNFVAGGSSASPRI